MKNNTLKLLMDLALEIGKESKYNRNRIAKMLPEMIKLFLLDHHANDAVVEFMNIMVQSINDIMISRKGM